MIKKILCACTLALIPFVVVLNFSIHSHGKQITSSAYTEEIQKIERYLENPIPGVNATYKEVIDAIIVEGYDVYLKGGVVRDLLSDPALLPYDVDFAFSCTVEELKHILMKNRWTFTNLPNRDIVTIGNNVSQFMEGAPACQIIFSDINALEFTLNNIFYHCNTKSFLPGTEKGIEDLKKKELYVLSDDWRTWLLGWDVHPYYKIFRCWKMIGKGFSSSKEFESFVREQTERIVQENPTAFYEDLVAYFGNHYYCYSEVVRGCEKVMGKKWCEKHFYSLEAQARVKNEEFERRVACYTYKWDEENTPVQTHLLSGIIPSSIYSLPVLQTPCSDPFRYAFEGVSP